jgi:poly-beta-1,6-N-acetyl-D-glucosamine synthase
LPGRGVEYAPSEALPPLTYVVITPIRDERHNLAALFASLEQQATSPSLWMIVDTGSTDGSLELVREWMESRSWIRVVAMPRAHRERGGLVAEALEAGLAQTETGDLVVKVDADVTFDEDYFTGLLDAFRRDPLLGIASGRRLEQHRGGWDEQPVTMGGSQAQCRAYRRACLDSILPFEKYWGWDGVDELKARLLGWRTAVVDGVAFRHGRKVGARERSRGIAWWQAGLGAYYMGYRPYYLVLRALFRSRSDPAAIALIAGFFTAALTSGRRCPDPEVRAYLRRQQAPGQLRARVRETSGGKSPRQRSKVGGLMLVADPGGHLSELLALREVWERFERCWIVIDDVDTAALSGESLFIAHGPTQRSVWKLARNSLLAFRLVRRLRPSVILTTGAGLSVPFAWTGRLFGARVLYIECAGRVGISTSGRLVAPVAHRFYVQWPGVLPELPNAQYYGSISFHE